MTSEMAPEPSLPNETKSEKASRCQTECKNMNAWIENQSQKKNISPVNAVTSFDEEDTVPKLIESVQWQKIIL